MRSARITSLILVLSSCADSPAGPAAAIYCVVPGQAPQLYAGGFTQITDFDWGRDGSLYVVQHASAPFFNGPGALIRVAPGGPQAEGQESSGRAEARDLTRPPRFTTSEG